MVEFARLSFYGHLALERLHSEAAATPSPRLPQASDLDLAFTDAWRAQEQQPGFQLALQLLRLGEVELAKELWHAQGQSDAHVAWMASWLLQRAGYLRDGVSFARSLRHELGAWPNHADAWARLQIAYPRGYATFVQTASASDGVNANLVFAISREESSFDPHALSGASTHGVMQLIEPTARRMASSLGLPISRDQLRDPETNIRLGTRYLANLLRRYDQRHGFVPAAYNAGEGAVDRWLARHAEPLPFDAWVERIPYTETRRYTRRVLQTFCVYSALSGTPVPAWASI